MIEQLIVMYPWLLVVAFLCAASVASTIIILFAFASNVEVREAEISNPNDEVWLG